MTKPVFFSNSVDKSSEDIMTALMPITNVAEATNGRRKLFARSSGSDLIAPIPLEYAKKRTTAAEMSVMIILQL